MRAPDFFLVGHAKCGTTALYEMLRRHPQIFMPNVKEPQFFARNPQAPVLSGRRRAFEQTGRGTESLQEYLALFAEARPDQRVGEASTFYLWSDRAPAAIAKMVPDARIVAILREPVSFLHSLHLQMRQNGAETERSLRKALALESERRAGRHIPAGAYWPEALMYSERVRYVAQLRRYHAVFPPEQVLVLIYDDFRRDNEATVREVLRFLEVDDTVPIPTLSANPSIEVRSMRLEGAFRDIRRSRSSAAKATMATVKALVPTRLRHGVLYPIRRRIVYRAPQAPDDRLVADLRERFKGEVVAASEYLNRDLVKLWGYEGLL
jgi:hypothetical protein